MACRYSAICNPMRAQTMRTMALAKRVVVGVWGTTSMYCLLWFFLVDLDAGGCRGLQCAYWVARSLYLPIYLLDFTVFFLTLLLAATVLYGLIAGSYSRAPWSTCHSLGTSAGTVRPSRRQEPWGDGPVSQAGVWGPAAARPEASLHPGSRYEVSRGWGRVGAVCTEIGRFGKGVNGWGRGCWLHPCSPTHSAGVSGHQLCARRGSRCWKLGRTEQDKHPAFGAHGKTSKHLFCRILPRREGV